MREANVTSALHPQGARRPDRQDAERRGGVGYRTVFFSDPSNMAWLTGYDGRFLYVHQGLLLGQDGEPVWFGCGQDVNGAK
jgi:Xaa-Pro aminopeptidase